MQLLLVSQHVSVLDATMKTLRSKSIGVADSNMRLQIAVLEPTPAFQQSVLYSSPRLECGCSVGGNTLAIAQE